jgi:large subunit ribosomal protein L33
MNAARSHRDGDRRRCQAYRVSRNPPPFLDFAALAASFHPTRKGSAMAKAVTLKVKLVSSADTGFYYVTRKNSRTMTEKLKKKKYDPVARKHVEFTEQKIR